MDERQGPHGSIFGVEEAVAAAGEEPSEPPSAASVSVSAWPAPRRRVVKLWKHQLRFR